MAPEIFEYENYNEKVDIWSLGVLLFEIMHKKSPFSGDTVFSIY